MFKKILSKLTERLPTSVTSKVPPLRKIRLQQLEDLINSTKKEFDDCKNILSGLSIFRRATTGHHYLDVADRLNNLEIEKHKLG